MTAPSWFHRDLEEEDHGPDVKVVQRKLGVPVTGVMDTATLIRVRGVRVSLGLPHGSEVTLEVAEALGEEARAGLPPAWFTRDLHPGDAGDDVAEARHLFGLNISCVFDRQMEDAVRRLQSAQELPLTGVIDAATVTSVR